MTFKKLTWAVALASLGTVSAHAAPVAWSGNGHSYDFVATSGVVAWSAAKAQAEALGGHLATITSQGEQDFIVSNFAAAINGVTLGPWLGGYQINKNIEPGGNWAWVTGEAWSYTSWGPGSWGYGEPNNAGGDEDYLHFGAHTGFNGAWNDIPHATYGLNGYIVEYEASVPEPGILALLSLGLLGLGMARRRS